MWSTTLSLTLLLTAASLISGAALPPIPLSPPSRVPGLSLSCPRIPSKPAVLGPQRIRSPTTSVTAPRSLSARVIPYCIEGALAGGMISADFILLSGQAWTLYWEPERLVLGGTVKLFQTELGGAGETEMVDSTPMANRELNPFTALVNHEYFVEFAGPRQGRISWYMATQ